MAVVVALEIAVLVLVVLAVAVRAVVLEMSLAEMVQPLLVGVAVEVVHSVQTTHINPPVLAVATAAPVSSSLSGANHAGLG